MHAVFLRPAPDVSLHWSLATSTPYRNSESWVSSGLTSSLTINEIKDLLYIFLYFSGNYVLEDGCRRWPSSLVPITRYGKSPNMILPGAKGSQAVQVLHDRLALRGRCARVVLVCELTESDKRNESKSNLTIPAPQVGKFDFGLSRTLNWCLSFHIQHATYAQGGNW
jgi:hypothetical protein